MKFHLPTREECQEIVKNSEAFYCINTIVQGFEVEVYNYRLASLDNFKEYNAFELRGLCFVKQPTGTWERNILLNKFFNLNEVGPSSKTFLIELETGETIEVSEFDEIKLTNGKYKRARDLNIDDDIVI